MSPEELLVDAVQKNDLDAATRALALHPKLKSKLNDPLPGLPFDATILQPAVRWKNREMIALLQLSGADINTKTHWWAGGFSVLDYAEPEFVPFLLERGAKMTIHAAARLGDLEEVRRIVRANRNAARARGGDGQTPLHLASTVEIAEFLLDNDAEIDARDVDHESTAAQYRVREHPDVARFLVSRGAKTDILLAAALGDIDRVRAFLDADPSSVNVAVSDKYFPMKGRRAGGHIYIWTLGKNKTPAVVAHEFGHKNVLELLMARAPERLQLLTACQVGDEAAVRDLVSKNPNIIGGLSADERAMLSHAAQDENITAVRLMLEAGWPVDAPGQHGGTALHWAAFHGNTELARVILARKPSFEVRDRDFGSDPLGWAFHGSQHGWRCQTGDYAGTVTAMLDAGAKLPPNVDASEAVLTALRNR